MKPSAKINNSNYEYSKKKNSKGGTGKKTVTQREEKKTKERQKGKEQFFEQLVGTSDIPDRAIEMFFGFFNKDLVLTNLSRKDIKRLINKFEESRSELLRTKSSWEYSFDEELFLSQVKLAAEERAHRSLEGFERKMEKMEQKRQVIDQKNDEGSKSGILAKLLGKGKQKEEKDMKRRVEGVPQ